MLELIDIEQIHNPVTSNNRVHRTMSICLLTDVRKTVHHVHIPWRLQPGVCRPTMCPRFGTIKILPNVREHNAGASARGLKRRYDILEAGRMAVFQQIELL